MVSVIGQQECVGAEVLNTILSSANCRTKMPGAGPITNRNFKGKINKKLLLMTNQLGINMDPIGFNVKTREYKQLK
jgi:hypothetical protein